MTRRTKIVATIGPASDSPEMLRKLMDAGLDVVRLNLSHGELDEHLDKLQRHSKHNRYQTAPGVV